VSARACVHVRVCGCVGAYQCVPLTLLRRGTLCRRYARTQSQEDRICTIEAVALLLHELGECDEVCSGMISAVRTNNSALRPARSQGAVS
jgi:hypothetical protein